MTPVQKDKLPALAEALDYIKWINEMSPEEWSTLSNHDHEELVQLLSLCEVVVNSWKRNSGPGRNGFIVRQ